MTDKLTDERELAWTDAEGVRHSMPESAGIALLAKFWDEWPGGFEEIESAIKGWRDRCAAIEAECRTGAPAAPSDEPVAKWFELAGQARARFYARHGFQPNDDTPLYAAPVVVNVSLLTNPELQAAVGDMVFGTTAYYATLQRALIAKMRADNPSVMFEDSK